MVSTTCLDGTTSAPGWDGTRTFDAQIPIGPPHFSNSESGEKDQTGSVHIRELVTPQAFELADDRGMVLRVEGLECQPGELGQRQAKGSRRFLAEPMQEPTVGFRNDREGRMTPSRWARKQFDGGGMKSIRAIEKCDENSAIQEDGVRFHGRGRP